jgi:glycosyltransferase involved in cell wall biosynthesis
MRERLSAHAAPPRTAAPDGVLQGRCVLEVCRVPFLGGAERIALDCARAVQAGGGRAIVACPPGGQLAESATRQGVEVRALQAISGRRGLLADLLRAAHASAGNKRVLKEVVTRDGVDLIQAHHPIGALQAAALPRALRPRLVLHVHETLPAPRQYRALAPWLKANCDAFICVSDAGRRLLQHLGMPQARVHLVYNAVGAAFLGQPEPAPLGPGPHIGVFGVLEPRKGQAELIAAFARVAAAHPSAQLWVVGEVSYARNADYVASLEAAAAATGVAHRVRFTGYRHDVRELMAAMDVVVLASNGFESLPTVLLEAGALGRVLVATDVGGVREIITHGVTGLVVRPGDVAGLAEALLAALCPAAAALGRGARAAARARFSPERFAGEISSLLDEVLRSPPAAR